MVDAVLMPKLFVVEILLFERMVMVEAVLDVVVSMARVCN